MAADNPESLNFFVRYLRRTKELLFELLSIAHSASYQFDYSVKWDELLKFTDNYGKFAEPAVEAAFKEIDEALKPLCEQNKLDPTVLRSFYHLKWICVLKKINGAQVKMLLPYLEQIFKSPFYPYLLRVFSLTDLSILTEKMEPHAFPFRMLLAPLQKTAGLREEEWAHIFKTLESPTYQEGPKREIVIQSLYTLLQSKQFTDLEKGVLLRNTFSIPQNRGAAVIAEPRVHVQLQVLSAIISSPHVDLLRTPKEQVKEEADVKHHAALSAVGALRQPLDLEEILVEITKIEARTTLSNLCNSKVFTSIDVSQLSEKTQIKMLSIAYSKLAEDRFIKDFSKMELFMKLIKDWNIAVKPDIEEAFRPISEMIEELKKVTPETRQKLREWLHRLKWICIAKKMSAAEITKLLPYVKQIFSFQEPRMRDLLAIILVNFEQADPTGEKHKHILLFQMLLNPLKKTVGLNEEEWKQIFKTLESEDYLDSKKKEIVVRSLYELLACEKFTGQEKGILLQHIFRVNQKDTAKNEADSKQKAATGTKLEIHKVHLQLQMLYAIIVGEGTAELRTPKGPAEFEADVKQGAANVGSLKYPIDLGAALNASFTKGLGLDAIENFAEKYAMTIGREKARNPTALLVYAAQLKTLPPDERPIALKALKEFTTNVLNGTYPKWRYETRNTPGSHLEMVFSGQPEKVFEEWQRGERIENMEALAKMGDDKLSAFNIGQYFQERIKNVHSEDLSEFVKCLNDNETDTRKKSLSEIGIKLKEKTEAAKKISGRVDPKDKTILTLKLEQDLLKLLDPSQTVEMKLALLDAAAKKVETIYGKKQFYIDLISLKDFVKEDQQKTKLQHYSVEDTDDWEDMLLIGDVSGSCQRIGGDVENNKCLLGYLSDGKNRAIVMKDPTGKIVARCIMRLLWDPVLKKPVIYQERLYNDPEVAAKLADKIITAMFVRRANALGFAIVRQKGNAAEKNYPNDLISGESPRPWEYVDAGGTHGAGGLQIQTGPYTVRAQEMVSVAL